MGYITGLRVRGRVRVRVTPLYGGPIHGDKYFKCLMALTLAGQCYVYFNADQTSIADLRLVREMPLTKTCTRPSDLRMKQGRKQTELDDWESTDKRVI